MLDDMITKANRRVAKRMFESHRRFNTMLMAKAPNQMTQTSQPIKQNKIPQAPPQPPQINSIPSIPSTPQNPQSYQRKKLGGVSGMLFRSRK